MERVTKNSGVNESLDEKHASSIRSVSLLAAADTLRVSRNFRLNLRLMDRSFALWKLKISYTKDLVLHGINEA